MIRPFLPTCLALLALAAAAARAEPVTIHLENGARMDVQLVRIDGERIHWRVDDPDVQVEPVPLERIAWVDFPPPKAWETARDAFAEGRYEDALQLFRNIADDRGDLHHPVPGNFASLAQRRILDCQRRLLLAPEVARQVELLEKQADALPPQQRALTPVERCWAALGREEWEKARRLAESAEEPEHELAYLKGRASQGLGRDEEALEAYTAVYTFGLGSQPRIAADALRRSAEILAALDGEGRRAELRAQLKIYRELYGAGSLWDGAPERLVRLADGEVELMSTGEGEPKPKSKSKSKPDPDQDSESESNPDPKPTEK